MKHISLFAGVGGIDFAAEKAGFETIAQVERDDYATKVLEKHWPDVHRIRDIRDFPDRDYGAVTLISGGFPCQPFSAAGKRRGAEDDRFLWPEMLRVICEIMPAWVLAENVPGLLSLESGMVIESMLTDLEVAGYEVFPPLLIPAAGVGAPHLRYRVFIVAHSNGGGLSKQEVCEKQQKRTETIGASQDVADTQKLSNSSFCHDGNSKSYSQSKGQSRGSGLEENRKPSYWAPEPNVGRVAHGISSRVDRLRCLGNACVPLQCLAILQAIGYIERHENNTAY